VWSTSPSDHQAGPYTDQSLRLVVYPTLGGTRVRVRLSNRFGTEPVTFGAASIADAGAGAAVASATLRRLRFAGKRSITVPPGGEVVSSPVRLRFGVFQELAVSLHVRGTIAAATEHISAIQRSYVSAPGSGDHTRDVDGTAYGQVITRWPFLTDVEVRAPKRVGALVALGDSITDGLMSPVDQNLRYPDVLARRLVDAGIRLAVQIEGISGNEILRDGALPSFGPKLLDRLPFDALDQAGASVVLLMEGTNDLGVPPTATAEAVIAGLQTCVDRLHAAGLRVILGTIPPCKDFAFDQSGSPEAIAKRNVINDWIRTSGVAEGVVDFHAALKDPADPDRMLPAFDSGDHIHPSAAGYQAMADAIDLSLLARTGPGCGASALVGR
jgi:lysophospholipase L1-like esterase